MRQGRFGLNCRINRTALAAALFILMDQNTWSHENICTHPQITRNARALLVSDGENYSDSFPYFESPAGNSGNIVYGTIHEDDAHKFFDHFYEPPTHVPNRPKIDLLRLWER